MADYTYVSARVKALESALLSPSHIELLTTAKGVDELHTVLYDTYLAPYLKRGTEGDVLAAIDEQVHDTKALLTRIVPVPELLDVLWLKYDYHNIKVAVKGVRSGHTDEAILSDCYREGTVSPEVVLEAARNSVVRDLTSEFAATIAAAKEVNGSGAVDELCNAAYFQHIHACAAAYQDPFAAAYVRALVDLFNVKALVRGELREVFRARNVLLNGGSCPVPATLDTEAIARLRTCYGTQRTWKAVVQGMGAHESVVVLEKKADDAFSLWLKEEAVQGMSFASVVSYFHAVKNNAQIVSAIVKAKRAGMAEKDLRTILRARHL